MKINMQIFMINIISFRDSNYDPSWAQIMKLIKRYNLYVIFKKHITDVTIFVICL